MKFTAEILSYGACEEIVFECGNLKNAEPFGMAVAARSISDYIQRCPNTKFSFRSATQSYPTFMGFFAAAGISQAGHTSNYKPWNNRYHQLTKFQGSEIVRQAINRGIHPNDIVEEKAQEVATILSSKATDLQYVLAYSIREMMRNVLEHSNSSDFLICAQLWPKNDLAEFAIVDSGIGLRSSLCQNKELKVPSDLEALQLAMTPGISKSTKAARESDDPWTNSGLGLYITSRICQEGGSFSIFSGDYGLQKSKSPSRLFACTFKGTGIRLQIKPSMIGNAQQNIKKYLQDASQISKGKIDQHLGLSPSSILQYLKKQPN
ncbi:MAG: ATP-binding protein [Bdellovibrionota bacterium]